MPDWGIFLLVFGGGFLFTCGFLVLCVIYSDEEIVQALKDKDKERGINVLRIDFSGKWYTRGSRRPGDDNV